MNILRHFEKGRKYLLERFISCLEDFEHLLREATVEEEVQLFLNAHQFLLTTGNPFDSSFVVPKLRLGVEYVTDFAVCDLDQRGYHWELIELERPDARLFTKSGDPTKELTHAIGQVQRWRRWVSDNSEYCRNLFHKSLDLSFFHIEGRKEWHRLDDLRTSVIIGRKEALTDQTRDTLHQMNVDFRGTTEIMTYDKLLDRAYQNLMIWR